MSFGRKTDPGFKVYLIPPSFKRFYDFFFANADSAFHPYENQPKQYLIKHLRGQGGVDSALIEKNFHLLVVKSPSFKLDLDVDSTLNVFCY